MIEISQGYVNRLFLIDSFDLLLAIRSKKKDKVFSNDNNFRSKINRIEEEKEERGIDKLRISGRLNTAGIRFFRSHRRFSFFANLINDPANGGIRRK